MMWGKCKSALQIGMMAAGLIAFGSMSSWAHDANIGTVMDPVEIGGTGADNTFEVNHQDEDPWKGWVNLTVTNTGTQAWGDFHFQIYRVPDEDAVDGVDWVTDGQYAPRMDGTNLSNFVVDNDASGATLDLYFYSTPVNPGSIVNFQVYTDNTAHAGFFGVGFYPTPVPVPGALVLLGSGLVGLAGLRRRHR